MFPTLIRFGGFHLATYGVLAAAAYMTSILWLNTQRQRMGISESRLWGLIYAEFFGAIAGGKILYWIVEWDALLSGELRLIRDIRFGFVFFGGLIGTLVVGVYYTRKHRLNFWKLADYFLAALSGGMVIGRLACFAAGCCAGIATTMPWGVRFTHPESLVAYSLRGIPLHPTQLYEVAGNALIAVVAFRLLKRVQSGKDPQGTVALAFVGLYSAMRFVIEFFRGDDRGGFFLHLSPSQWVAFAGIAFFFYFGSRRKLFKRV